MASLYKKPQYIADPKTGQRTMSRTKKWYGRYRDADGTEHRVPLATDKRIAQQMLADLINQVERQKAGLENEEIVQAKKSLTEHIDDFQQHLTAKNDKPRHIRETINMIKTVARERKWRDLRDVKATELEAFLNNLWNVKKRSISRGNHYIRAFKTFGTWLVDNDRVRKHPFRKLKVLNAEADRRHHRRPLSMEEFKLLVEAAASGPPVESICGGDRVMLYYLAAWTGFRKGELGSLTLQHIFLDAPVPYIVLQAGYSKRKKNDIQYLHAGLVDLLKKWLARRNFKPNELLFPISSASGGIERKTSKMLEDDLTCARNFWIAESASPEEEKKRLESDFLKYKDSNGDFADFHGLRHTFITNLFLNGVDPKTAQTLARHSNIELTMNVYTHLNAQTQINAINALPSPGTDSVSPKPMQQPNG